MLVRVNNQDIGSVWDTKFEMKRLKLCVVAGLFDWLQNRSIQGKSGTSWFWWSLPSSWSSIKIILGLNKDQRLDSMLQILVHYIFEVLISLGSKCRMMLAKSPRRENYNDANSRCTTLSMTQGCQIGKLKIIGTPKFSQIFNIFEL